MEGAERRERLIQLLEESTEPLSGSALSKLLGVSRQVIVQDIALLRASDVDILSTTKGYVIYKKEKNNCQRVFHVNHTTAQIEDELCTIVDCGGKILNVCVNHPVYGTIETPLILSNRSEIYEFVKKVAEKQTTPLKELTRGEHSHKVEAASEQILNQIEQKLKEKRYLIS